MPTLSHWEEDTNPVRIVSQIHVHPKGRHLLYPTRLNFSTEMCVGVPVKTAEHMWGKAADCIVLPPLAADVV